MRDLMSSATRPGVVVRSLRCVAAIAALAIPAEAASCVARPQMCGSARMCSPSEGECVAGRCLPPNGGGFDGGGPEILSTSPAVRRIVAMPIDIALVHRGDGAIAGRLPTQLTLGCKSEGDATLLLRFAVPLSSSSKIVEAYLLLEQSDAVDAAPDPLSLHLARILEPWESQTVSWGLLPRILDQRAPETRVVPGSRGVVRIAATHIVRSWTAHDAGDQGIAVVASNATVTGITFVAGASTVPRVEELPVSARLDSVDVSRGEGPRLEMYVK
jgi:hypothetical protein